MSCHHCGLDDAGFHEVEVNGVGMYSMCHACKPLVLKTLCAVKPPQLWWFVKRSNKQGTKCVRRVFESAKQVADFDVSFDELTRQSEGETYGGEYGVSTSAACYIPDILRDVWQGNRGNQESLCTDLSCLSTTVRPIPWGSSYVLKMAWRGWTQGEEIGPVVTFQSFQSRQDAVSKILAYVAKHNLQGVPFLTSADVGMQHANTNSALAFFAFPDKPFKDFRCPIISEWYPSIHAMCDDISRWYQPEEVSVWEPTRAFMCHLIASRKEEQRRFERLLKAMPLKRKRLDGSEYIDGEMVAGQDDEDHPDAKKVKS